MLLTIFAKSNSVLHGCIMRPAERVKLHKHARLEHLEGVFFYIKNATTNRFLTVFSLPITDEIIFEKIFLPYFLNFSQKVSILY